MTPLSCAASCAQTTLETRITELAKKIETVRSLRSACVTPPFLAHTITGVMWWAARLPQRTQWAVCVCVKRGGGCAPVVNAAPVCATVGVGEWV
jgi:hypothetical protein